MSGEEYSRVYDEMGANINAFTARDYTNFFALFPGVSSNGDNNLEMAMFLESDRFKHINYTEDAFKLEGRFGYAALNNDINLYYLIRFISYSLLCSTPFLVSQPVPSLESTIS